MITKLNFSGFWGMVGEGVLIPARRGVEAQPPESPPIPPQQCIMGMGVEGRPSNKGFLPLASEGWGRQCFHFVHHWRGGVPQSQVLSQVTGPRSFLGGTSVLS